MSWFFYTSTNDFFKLTHIIFTLAQLTQDPHSPKQGALGHSLSPVSAPDPRAFSSQHCNYQLAVALSHDSSTCPLRQTRLRTLSLR